MTSMKLSNLFITGCDRNTRWMLPWFQENFYDHNPAAELVVYDFDTFRTDLAGWFKKPAAMIDAARQAENVCWLDTDMEILGNLESIWNYVVPGKLGMVEDTPWSNRRGETWHNSGTVLFKSKPPILDTWANLIKTSTEVGDQEVLHEYIRQGMNRLVHIETIPATYNCLRLMTLDGIEPKHILIRHHTGYKGKDHIKRLMKNG